MEGGTIFTTRWPECNKHSYKRENLIHDGNAGGRFRLSEFNGTPWTNDPASLAFFLAPTARTSRPGESIRSS